MYDYSSAIYQWNIGFKTGFGIEFQSGFKEIWNANKITCIIKG